MLRASFVPFIAGIFLAAAANAVAQWKVPDELAPLPPDGQSCNDARTHCVVNARDWFVHKAATDVLATRIAQLQFELEVERAHKEKRCAVVTPSTLFVGERTR